MTINDIKTKLQSSEYNFLKTNSHLGNNIILLGLGGSHAYGTNIESSDVDIRGCALNSKTEILTNLNFEQFENKDTDTTIYSFNKLIHLLSNCNPNVIEILGLKPEHYIYLSSIGQELINNRKLFLSKKAIHTFGGYANSQLHRLDNKAARLVGQAEQEQHILNTINNAAYEFKNKYFPLSDEDSISLYLDTSMQENLDKEIFMDINLTHYPLRDYKSMWSEMHNIVKDYSKIGHRNTSAIEHNRLGKHMMHLIRLYLMCLDILERGEIITYREADRDLLMDIRNGKYLDNNKQPVPEFYDMVNELEKKLEYAKNNTDLPENPNYNAIQDFTMSVNEKVVNGSVHQIFLIKNNEEQIKEDNIELNSHGVNAKIKAHILSDEEMRKIGFTDCAKDRWYFFRMLDKKSEISFNVTIPKNESDIKIDILDEDFGQPYDYQYMLNKNPNFEFALKIKDKVEKWMTYLQNNGVLSGHKYGEYI